MLHRLQRSLLMGSDKAGVEPHDMSKHDKCLENRAKEEQQYGKLKAMPKSHGVVQIFFVVISQKIKQQQGCSEPK